jgi:hypothetical protein
VVAVHGVTVDEFSVLSVKKQSEIRLYGRALSDAEVRALATEIRTRGRPHEI